MKWQKNGDRKWRGNIRRVEYEKIMQSNDNRLIRKKNIAPTQKNKQKVTLPHRRTSNRRFHVHTEEQTTEGFTPQKKKQQKNKQQKVSYPNRRTNNRRFHSHTEEPRTEGFSTIE
jgi:hypothetical protein